MATKPSSVTLQFPTTEFRSLPLPLNSKSPGDWPKMASFFVPIEDVPEALKDWMEVNPRVPKVDKQSNLKGPVAKRMLYTLKEEPELFALKNQGMWLSASTVNYAKLQGGKGVVEITLENSELHGLVNGGHTFQAILEARERAIEEGASSPSGAYVRIHVLEGVVDALGEEVIPQIADGLNRSMQVDDKSLANLEGLFENIKLVMKGMKGEQEIAYHQGHEGEVDVLHVLMVMALFNLDKYDRKRHPNTLFGHSKNLIAEFEGDLDAKNSAYKKILPRLPELLVLSERIQQEMLKNPEFHIGRVKISNSKKGNRVASKANYHPAIFANGMIEGRIPFGWLYPALASLRANVDRAQWAKGNFKWIAPPEDVIKAVADDLARHCYNTYKAHDDKPAEVGRREDAYTLCYSAVSVELAEKGLLGAA